MAYGVIEYDSVGNPKCEICDKHFIRVLTHVRQKHDMDERTYKKIFGFDLKKGICSKESSELSRGKVMDNYDQCVSKNLLDGGKVTRYEDGDKGRTKDQVSEQTRLMLIARLKNDQMQKVLKESGKRLGDSGTGNAARWGKKNESNLILNFEDFSKLNEDKE